jgi:hypothetical protein
LQKERKEGFFSLIITVFRAGLLGSEKMNPNAAGKKPKGRAVKFWKMKPNAVGKTPKG